MRKRKHDYQTRKDCPNFHPITPEDPDGWCGCGTVDVEYELKWNEQALQRMYRGIEQQKAHIEFLKGLL